jgi:dihydroorotate dehydrogenase
VYEFILKPLLFLFPAEKAHHLGMIAVRIIGWFHRIGLWPRPQWSRGLPTKTPFGSVENPLGLAAGFDKNALGLWGWQALGFGFVEIGTVTPKPQTGNPTPRLFRYTKINAVVNRMGFNNDGVLIIADRIRKAKKAGLKIKVGGNVGKNFWTTTQDAPKDYTLAVLGLKDFVDYIVINVSSPNTPGLRDLQSERNITSIVSHVKTASGSLPVFIKVAPDDFENFKEGLLNVAKAHHIAGIICGNTKSTHDLEKGGLSGQPIFESNLNLCKAYATEKSLFIIGAGGISNPNQGHSYFEAGAKLLQIYTGLIYGGPSLPKKLVLGLKALLQIAPHEIDHPNVGNPL